MGLFKAGADAKIGVFYRDWLEAVMVFSDALWAVME